MCVCACVWSEKWCVRCAGERQSAGHHHHHHHHHLLLGLCAAPLCRWRSYSRLHSPPRSWRQTGIGRRADAAEAGRVKGWCGKSTANYALVIFSLEELNPSEKEKKKHEIKGDLKRTHLHELQREVNINFYVLMHFSGYPSEWCHFVFYK